MPIVSDIIFGIQLVAAGVGLVLYVASFFGRGIEDGTTFLVPALVCTAIMSVPTAIRDRRFFLKHWGFGLLGLRENFPFEMFPARVEGWLNPLAWFCMAILLFHFLLLVLSNSSARSGLNDAAELRYLSLMVAVAGGLSALGWKFPPTQKPDEEAPS